MTNLKIDKGNTELEIYEADGKNLITLDLTLTYKHETEYVSIDLTKDDAIKVIKFLQAQVE